MIICEQGIVLQLFVGLICFYSAKGRSNRKFVICCKEEGTVNNDDDLVVCDLCSCFFSQLRYKHVKQISLEFAQDIEDKLFDIIKSKVIFLAIVCSFALMPSIGEVEMHMV